MLSVLEPVLASTGANSAPVEDWAVEPKLDGWLHGRSAHPAQPNCEWQGRDRGQ